MHGEWVFSDIAAAGKTLTFNGAGTATHLGKWTATGEIAFEDGDFLHCKGKVQNFQGGLQVILNHVSRIEPRDVPLADFLPKTEHDVSKLLDKLRGTLRKLNNPHLRALSESFLMDELTIAPGDGQGFDARRYFEAGAQTKSPPLQSKRQPPPTASTAPISRDRA